MPSAARRFMTLPRWVFAPLIACGLTSFTAGCSEDPPGGGLDSAVCLCGDGVVCPTEECDDGNTDDGDGCQSDCRLPICGDRVLDSGEECDDGPGNSDLSPDACRSNCRFPVCGDQVVDSGEACDEGTDNSDEVPDACRQSCQESRCGDGVVDSLEICDCGSGALNLPERCSGINGAGDCSTLCRFTFCGNGIVDPGEVCDDGNNAGGDGCSPDCQSDESCGNSITDLIAEETCDCGTDLAALPPVCSDINGGGDCRDDCTRPACGDGEIDPGEICDDGNNLPGDDCSPDCRSAGDCGNGYADFGEACDCGSDASNLPYYCPAPNGDPASPCSALCESALCGDGTTHAAVGEICDDGNNDRGDGCSPDCFSDETCGNGYLDYATEQCDCGTDATQMPHYCDQPNGQPGSYCTATCRLRGCGNGIEEAGEDCDDGNNDGGDGCSSICTVEECGNGVVDVQAGETCDDGNVIGGDGCSTTCLWEYCGNGVVDSVAGEICDDDNNLSGDGCSADCLSEEGCGNGIVDLAVGEACDPQHPTNGPACTANCALPTCGDGIVDTPTGEVCDCGTDPGSLPAGCPAVNGAPDANCNDRCSSRQGCGNGVVDAAAGEECDDGNNLNGDGCRANCKLPTCGDNIRDASEICDDGNTNDGDGCAADCDSDESCGNGQFDTAISPPEVCDDGNNVAGDGCAADCQSDETCGNGVWDPLAQPPEACDDGNSVGNDGCAADCRSDESCGNGRLDTAITSPEVCDDGNNVNGDGCAADCGSDETCGNGIVDVAQGELCDDGAALSSAPDAACRPDCRPRRCGDGVVDPASGEQCEGSDLAGQSCNSLGLNPGALACDGACRLVTTGCNGRCGDGVLNAPDELCDSTAFGPATCGNQGPGYYAGVLTCTADCGSIRTVGCFGRCGDGQRDASFGETCDGTDLAGQTCGSQGQNGGTLACQAGCTGFDLAGCNGRCGDGVVNSPDEECDGGNLDGQSCGSLGLNSGALGCGATCRFVTTGCNGRCRDGALDAPDELCDGTAFGAATCGNQGPGYYAGVLTCSADCGSIGTTGCHGRCGDGQRDSGFGETCDGSDLAGETCASQGQNAGTLACQAGCAGFDLAGCNGRCGDGAVDAPDEECDGTNLAGQGCGDFGFYAGLLGCSGCQLDLSGCSESCGDGIKNGPETCDGSDTGGETCADQIPAFYGGTLGCSQDCQTLLTDNCHGQCGDGQRDGAFGEDCDGADVGGATCQSWWYLGGTVSCTANCFYDISTCDGTCGDNVANAPFEECDGSDLGSMDCRDWGFYGGTPTCAPGCYGDWSSCSGRCGDGTIDATELCDNWNVGGATCADLVPPRYFGSPSCDASCSSIGMGGCWGFCGDGVMNGPEQCDASDLGGLNCEDYGYWGGTLKCDASCLAEPGACNGYCGDGVISGPEQCDGLLTAAPHCLNEGHDLGAMGCGSGCDSSEERCGHNDWQVHYSPTSSSLMAVWAASPRDVWIGGIGMLLRWDGDDWREINDPVIAGMSFKTIWGSGPDDVWLAGYFGKVVHWDGVIFTELALPGQSEHLNGIWGAGADNFYLVGDATRVWHNQAGAWATEDTGAPAGTNFTAVWGSDANNVYVVGNGGQVRHWNGLVWSYVDVGAAGGGLTNIWGSSATDIYIVGNSGWTYHWDGAVWTPSQPGGGLFLYAVHGTGPDDVYIGGMNGRVLHWNGVAWRQRDVAPDDSIWSIWATGPWGVFAAGNNGRYWQLNHLWQLEGATGFALNSVWAAGVNDWTAVGWNSGPVRRYDGNSWQTTNFAATLNAVWGTDATRIYAVGVGGAFWGFDGVVWTDGGAAAAVDLLGLDGDAFSGEMVTVGKNGTLVEYDPGAANWLPPLTPAPTPNDLNDVWRAPDGQYFVVGDQGTILRYTAGGGYVIDPAVTTRHLEGVWGTTGTDVYAVGGNGTILHWDGSNWSAQESHTGVELNAISGHGSDQITVVGRAGAILLFDGSRWSPIKTFTSKLLWDVYAYPAYPLKSGRFLPEFVAVGEAGLDLWRYSGDLNNAQKNTDRECQTPVRLYCGATVTGSNLDQYNQYANYNGALRPTPGHEIIYRIDSPIDGQLDLQLTPHEADLDLVVLPQSGTNDCAAFAPVVGVSQNPGLTIETISIPDAVQGQSYYVAVDSPVAGTYSGFTLQLGCIKN